MNLNELANVLELIGIRSEVVALGNHTEMRWCVEQADDGAWEVYWRERGNKIELVRVANESTACTQALGSFSVQPASRRRDRSSFLTYS